MFYLFKQTRVIIILSVAGIIAIGSFAIFGNNKPTANNYITVEKRDLVQEVNVTGRVKSSQEVNLAFERSGKVASVQASVGDKVLAGQIVAILENSDLMAQTEQAKASVRAEEAKLRELQAGTRPEEIEVHDVKVKNAETALEDARNNLVDKLNDAYTKSDDAVRNKADQIFSSPEGAAPKLILSLDLTKLQRLNVTVAQIEEGRFSAGGGLIEWQASLLKLNSASDLDAALAEAKGNLERIKNFLDKAGAGINSALPTTTASQTSIDSWKADISTGRANVNTAIINLSTAEEKLRSAESSLALERQELLLAKAGTVPEQIAAQEAKLEQAVANVKNIQAQINQTILTAPFDGIITKQDAKVGEIVSVTTPVVSIISEAEFEVEANVPEADIAKIKVQSPAKITLDAYGDDVVFQSRTVLIDPAETMIEGVATYKTTFEFISKDDRIRSGMTADIQIIGEKREGVFAVPQRTVIEKGGEKFVLVADKKNKTIERKIETGLRGSDGYIEVVSGLSGGEKILASGGIE